MHDECRQMALMRLCGGGVQVKQGAENMISMYSAMKDKKMCAESQQMLSDAKHKVEYIRMQLLRLEQQKETTSLNNSENNDEQTGTHSTHLYRCMLCCQPKNGI